MMEGFHERVEKCGDREALENGIDLQATNRNSRQVVSHITERRQVWRERAGRLCDGLVK